MKKFWKFSNAKQNKNCFSVSFARYCCCIHCFHSFLFHSFYGYCFRFIGCNFTLFYFICFACEVENEAQREKNSFQIFSKLKNCFNSQQLNVTTKIFVQFLFLLSFVREVQFLNKFLLKTLAHRAASTMLNWISRENDTRLPKPKRSQTKYYHSTILALIFFMGTTAAAATKEKLERKFLLFLGYFNCFRSFYICIWPHRTFSSERLYNFIEESVDTKTV